MGASGSVSPTRMQSKLAAGTVVSSEDSTTPGWTVYSQAHTHGCWQTLVLTMWASPQGCSERGSLPWQLVSPKQVIQVRKNKKGLPRRKPQSFYNLVSEVISHYISQYILFIRNESVSPICTLAEGTTQAHEYPRGGIIEAYLKGHLPHPP